MRNYAQATSPQLHLGYWRHTESDIGRRDCGDWRRKMTPEALMRKVAKNFEKGDLQPLLDAIDENTVWKAGPLQSDGPLRFGGDYKKRAGVLEITSLLATLYVFQRFEPR